MAIDGCKRDRPMKMRLSAGSALSAFRHVLISLALVAGGWVQAHADAHDHIKARAWFEDTSGQMTLAQVRQADFVPYQSVLSRGFGSSPVWVRLTIDPTAAGAIHSAAQEDKLILRIRPVYLDHVELFDPAFPAATPRVTGDRWPSKRDEFRSANLNFEIPRGQAPRDIYLKLTSSSTRLLYVEAYSLRDLYTADSRLMTWYGVALGLSMLFLVWGLVSWLISKELLLGAFVASQTASVVISVLILGFARFSFGDWIAPAWLDTGTSVLVVFTVFVTLWYYTELWREFAPARWAFRSLQALLWVFPVQMLLFAAGYASLALQINWVVVLVTPIPNLVIALTARGWNAPENDRPALIPRSIMLAYFTFHLGFMMYAAMTALGAFEHLTVPLYLVIIHALLNGVLAVLLLQYRFFVSRAHQNQLGLRLALSEQQVAREREFLRERDSLLAMLTHELKTAMSAISVLLGGKRGTEPLAGKIREAIFGMDEVINKTMEMARFDNASVQLKLAPLDLVAECRAVIGGLDAREQVAIQAPDAFVIPCDHEVFTTIMNNLLSNALKYRAANSVVELVITPQARASSGVAIDVINQAGPVGFPDPHRVFGKYYRSPLSKGYTGSGLGLYLVKGLVSMLGGEVSYAQRDNNVRFTLWLPT